MLRIHEVKHTAEGAETSTYVAYEAPHNCNLLQVIHDAALDCCVSTAKKPDSNVVMRYLDFVETVPSEYCEKYGVKKLRLSDIAEPQNSDAVCLSTHELVRYNADLCDAAQQDIALHRVYAAIAKRLEPALRKNTVMADWSFSRVAKQMLRWSEEFVQAGLNPYGRDMSDFITEKLRSVKRTETDRSDDSSVTKS